ncbi:MAG: putative F420-dependent oxidoreductase, Rv1855c family [Jatrophihabitans sp.]|nr:putative F420-dependent oxidoreductase, Rv1855c family [Jatrophihabitans sp.]
MFGAHIGLQDATPQQVVELAVAAEESGFGWVSVWDHFYSSAPADGGSLDGVSMHALVAAATRRVRCGSLVYSASYRHPAVIAKAAATIDQISGGRAEVGVGAGFSVREHGAYGITLLPPGQRMDLLDEAVRCVRSLLHTPRSSIEGTYFTLTDARCDPRPIQPHLPVWVGGIGERRTLRIVAELADGWNAPFLSPEQFATKRAVLLRHCAEVGRDPGEIRCAANVGIGIGDAALAHHFATMGDTTHATVDAVVTGRGQLLVDQIGRWLEAGADQVNFTWRAPFDRGAMEAIAEAISAW